MVYLGCVLNEDGTSGTELSRQLGSSRAEFIKLLQDWSHASISRARKLEVYNACVVCKVTYNLHSLWLMQAEIQKLDAFHVTCLRRILKIAPSFYSRISNQTVLEKAQSRSISNILLEQQLNFFGALARRGNEDVLKSSVFDVSAPVLTPKQQ